MEVEFDKQYLAELYSLGKTTDKRHRFQPQVINGYLKCIRALLSASRIEDLFLYRSLNYEKLRGRANGQYRVIFKEIKGLESDYIEICNIIDLTNHYK